MLTRSMRPSSRLSAPICWLPVAVVIGIAVGGVSANEPTRPADTELPDAKPVTALQVIPLPYDQASFRLEGRELTRFHFGPSLRRPFLYPVQGPQDRSLTRMGQPSDPHGHRHHNSVWISHSDVEGVNFWGDEGDGRIVTLRVEQYADGDDPGPGASMVVSNDWRDDEGRTLMHERRRITVLADDPSDHSAPWMMLIDLELTAPDDRPVTFGETPFGIIGVRMARSIGVREGGGRLLNSEGQRDEAEMFRKPARWVDYSGPVTNTATGGLTLLDHPNNPHHPVPFHVRDEGWMGASLSFAGPITIPAGQPLRLRYGLWVHCGVPDRQTIDQVWVEFARQPNPPLPESF
jgi:hypothetical protein